MDAMDAGLRTLDETEIDTVGGGGTSEGGWSLGFGIGLGHAGDCGTVVYDPGANNFDGGNHTKATVCGK